MFRVIKSELEIGARWRLRMTSLENQNNAIFPFPRYYRTIDIDIDKEDLFSVENTYM